LLSFAFLLMRSHQGQARRKNRGKGEKEPAHARAMV
jgi:hypothetical protein